MTKAGWASSDITPPLGLPMGGRGPRFAEGTEIIDPLEAGAIVLEDKSGERLVLISIDLIGIGQAQSEALCYQIGAATGTNPHAVIINASHTHSGPMMNMERYATLKSKPAALARYEEDLSDKLLRLAIAAAANLQKVDVFWRDGTSNIGINRRLMINGNVVMGPNPDGRYHNQLWTLELKPQNDAPGCVLFSHACHPVIMYGHAWTAISSEWPGRCRKTLGSALGNAMHFQFMQGLAGNIRPRILGDLEKRQFRKSIPEDVERVGQEIAHDVMQTLWQEVEPLQLKLRARRGWFLVRRGTPPPRQYWENLQASDDELTREMADYWLTRYGKTAIAPYSWQPWPLGLVDFTPQHSLVYLAGEPLCEWFDVFQHALPDRKLVACGYTHAGAAYLPTDALLKEGGYEITHSPAYATSGPAPLLPGLNDAVIEALQELQG